ncbi:MAG: menaquinone biosynthesis protein [Acidobacteria bacterium]|nr:menaquinone biosynthesis protein [Acidobacteriota bacterium]
MSKIRVAAVEYLNALPLVHGLDAQPDLFAMQYDVPARCAALLHDGTVDLSLIPSIEYLQRPNYRIVPGVAVGSHGPVASVALFSKRPATAIRSIAVDSSSRTANALLRILCVQWFDTDPTFVKMRPDLEPMLKRCDAALIIGDRALFIDHETAGLEKIDLGEEWSTMTGMPFVWAFWAGRPGVVGPEHLAALQAARDRGVEAHDEIAGKFVAPDDDEERLETVRGYLRDNIECLLDDRRIASLNKFYEKANELGVVPTTRPLRFYDGADFR